MHIAKHSASHLDGISIENYPHPISMNRKQDSDYPIKYANRQRNRPPNCPIFRRLRSQNCLSCGPLNYLSTYPKVALIETLPLY